jgi:hypothetical protein
MATGIAAIRHILVNDPDVSAIVGGRVYPDWLKQDTEMPAVALWTVSSTAFDCMDGGIGMEKNDIRLECISTSRSQSDDLWIKVNKALTQTNKKGLYNGVMVQSLNQATGSYHMADRPYDGSDRWIYRTIQSFDIYYYLYEKA